MENQIVEVRSAVNAMMGSPTFSVLLEQWKVFSLALGINDVDILDLERKLNLGTLRFINLPHEILKLWKAANGSTAAVTALHDALVSCGVNDIAESLIQNLSESRSKATVKFIWQDKILTLENLLPTSTETYQNIYDSLKQYTPIRNIPLLEKYVTPAKLPTYYIERKLNFKTELDTKILTEEDKTRDHIFLVKNVVKNELARATGYQPVDISGNQLQKVTVKFMVLECDDDFERICARTTEPVHVVHFNGQRLFWEKSSRSLEAIYRYIRGGKGDIFSEEEIVQKITAVQTKSNIFCISDSPGMGKTLILANLARKVQETCSNCIVLFIVLQEFVQQINVIDSTSSAVEAIASYSAPVKVSSFVLEEVMKNKDNEVYLFLDGYDEILPKNLPRANSFLLQIKTLENVKTILTTRPHMRNRLENLFNQLSYEICPFTDQHDFLTRYWVNQCGAKDGPALHRFSQQCLSALSTRLTDKEKEIAGIPLQTMMLAEVYAEEAVRYSKLVKESKTKFNVVSFFDMFSKLVELKFSRISKLVDVASMPDRLLEKCTDAHVHDAITLLFPELIDQFQPYLWRRDSIEDGLIYSVGLIEHSPSTSSPRFVHRTFAEYLIAEYLVKNLRKYNACVDLFFGGIFGRKGVVEDVNDDNRFRGFMPKQYLLKYPVVAYFIEMFLERCLQNHTMYELLPLEHLSRTEMTEENLCIGVVACCCENLENCFGLTSKALISEFGYSVKRSVRYKYFHELPILSVLSSDNVSLVEKVLDFAKIQLDGELRYHVNPDFFFYYSTPLHVAVFQGKYNIVAYLIRTYGRGVRNMEGLLHACVYESAENTEPVIEDKLSNIDLLVRINSQWLQQKFYDYRTPLLLYDVHIKLLHRLVEHGSNINAYSWRYGTVLHTSHANNPYNDLVRWALSNDFDLINHTDKDGITPLMFCEGENDEVLELFYEAGADFNAQDKRGDSVLFWIIINSGGINVIRKILDYGANVNHTNKKRENLAHIMLRYGYFQNAGRITPAFDLIASKGFKLINAKNSNGETPYDYAKQYTGNEEVLKVITSKRKQNNACCLVQ